MDAPRVRWPKPVPRPLLDSLWLHPGGPVWDPFLGHFGDGFGTHFGAHLERLNYPVEEQEGIRKLRRSVSQPGKLPLHSSQVTEAERTLAAPAGVAASAIRRMSPFWFFLELWNWLDTGTGSGPGGGGQTSLKLMDGRSLVPLDQPCLHLTFGLPLAPSWGSGFGLISGPFRRRFQDSFWSSFGAPKVSKEVARRHTES